MTRSRQFIFAIVSAALILVGCGSDNNGSAADFGSFSGNGVSGWSTVGTAGAGGSTTGTIATAGSTVGAAGNAGQSTKQTAGKGGAKAAAGNSGKGGAGGTTGSAGKGGASGTAGKGTVGQEKPVCTITDPSQFKANLSVGGGGTNYKESEHFVVFGSNPDVILNFMEAAEKCFVQDWCWRSTGLSTKSDDSGPFYKTNIYSMGFLNAGGYSSEDMATGLSYIQVLSSQASDPKTTVHEWGHCLSIAGKGWINQTNTGFWWEGVANFVAYTFLTSPYCEAARSKYKVNALNTIIDQMNTLTTIYGATHSVICNNKNYYQIWPFWTYIINNPDGYPGIGRMTLPEMWKTHKGNNETPLHQLERMAAPVTVQTILGRYWARMAYFDIGLPVGQQDFLKSRNSLGFAANLDSSGSGTYTVKADRKPAYFGANITPLKVSGSEVSVTVKNLGNGLTESNFTATLAIFRSSDNSARYVDLPKGSGKATIESGEEVSLVVANTPDTLYMYNCQSVGSPENVGLNYQVQITGATP